MFKIKNSVKNKKMDKTNKREAIKNKVKIIPKIAKKNKLKKEKTEITVFKDIKKPVQEQKENPKLTNKSHKINNISSKKYSMDNRETTSNTNIKINNLTDSSEILIDKKKILNAETSNKKINLKAKYNKNSEEKEKNLYLNNKDYNINPFLINIKSNNQEKIVFSSNNNKDNDKENNNKKEENKIIKIEKNLYSDNIRYIDFNKRKTFNKENLNTMDFSFENKILNTIETKNKNDIYKNRFLIKTSKNKNNSKERKSEGSFGSIIHQKKLKLFSFNNENNINNINVRELTIASISSKNIIFESGNKEKKLLIEFKNDLKKIPKKKLQTSNRTSNKKVNNLNKNKNNIDSKSLNNNILDNNNKETKENKENKEDKETKDNKENIENKETKDNKETKENKDNKENKKIIKLETKINKNREILFNSKGKIQKGKIKGKMNFELIFPNKKYNKDIKYNKENKNNNINLNYLNPTKNKNAKKNTNNKTLISKNKKKLYNSNSTLSNIKLKQNNDKKLDLKSVDKDKPINIKRTISPTKIDIDLNLSKSHNIDFFVDRQYLLSSERYSSINKESSINSLLKDINKNGDNLNSIELFNISKNKFNNINKSPQLNRKKEENRILRTKTEMQDKNKTKNMINENNIRQNININLNVDKNDPKEIKKNKNTKNQKLINNEDVIMSLNTLDNETFKRSTVKKLIKNNQYKALLSDMATINLTKNIQKEKEKIKENDIKTKKKYRFSERRRDSYRNEPMRKLTESSENYINLYKKAFNDKSLEQKFSFKPKSKNKNYKYKNREKDKENEDENNKLLNKKVSTFSFVNKQKQNLDNDINFDDSPYHKNILSNSMDENKLYDKDEESEIDNNKNFILDLNHFIPIDENKLINTFSRPLFGNNINPKKMKKSK